MAVNLGALCVKLPLKALTISAPPYQPEQDDDDALMACFCASNSNSAAAFDTLYARYKDKTWRYFVRNFHDPRSGGDSGNEEAARDAQQELWLKLIERRHQYRPENRFAGYLFSMANSVFIDARRRRLRVIDASTDSLPNLDDLQGRAQNEPAQASHLARAINALRSAIAALPTSQRNTFVMHQESGMSYADIAIATDTSAETVKSRLRYARKKLAADLEEELRHVEL